MYLLWYCISKQSRIVFPNMKHDLHNPIAAEKPGEDSGGFWHPCWMARSCETYKSSITFSPWVKIHFSTGCPMTKPALHHGYRSARLWCQLAAWTVWCAGLLTPAGVVYVIHYVWKSLLQGARRQKSSSLDCLRYHKGLAPQTGGCCRLQNLETVLLEQ